MESVIEILINPLLTLLVSRQQSGEIRLVNLNMASVVIRDIVYILRNYIPSTLNAPIMIVSTPVNQLHEIGALLVRLIAERKGWRVTYLGANLPAEEIAAAIRYTNATAVVLSISFLTDKQRMGKELRQLKKLIGNKPALLVEGNGVNYYEDILNEIGVLKVKNHEDLNQILLELKPINDVGQITEISNKNQKRQNDRWIDERINRLQTISQIFKNEVWLTAKQINENQKTNLAKRSQPARDWKRNAMIYSVTYDEVEYFPAYQFDALYRPLPVIKKILKEFGTNIDTWKIASWFHFPNGWLTKDGQAIAPKDALNQDDKLLQALKRKSESYVA